MSRPSRIAQNKGITIKKDSKNGSASFVAEFVEEVVSRGNLQEDLFQKDLKKTTPEIRRAISQRIFQ